MTDSMSLEEEAAVGMELLGSVPDPIKVKILSFLVDGHFGDMLKGLDDVVITMIVFTYLRYWLQDHDYCSDALMDMEVKVEMGNENFDMVVNARKYTGGLARLGLCEEEFTKVKLSTLLTLMPRLCKNDSEKEYLKKFAELRESSDAPVSYEFTFAKILKGEPFRSETQGMLQKGACLLPALQGSETIKAFQASKVAGDDEPGFQLDVGSVFNLEMLEQVMELAQGLAHLQDMIYHDFTPKSRTSEAVRDRHTYSQEQFKQQCDSMHQYFTSLPRVCQQVSKKCFKLMKHDIYCCKQSRASRQTEDEYGQTVYKSFKTGDMKLADVFGDKLKNIAEKTQEIASHYQHQRMREVTKMAKGLEEMCRRAAAGGGEGELDLDTVVAGAGA